MKRYGLVGIVCVFFALPALAQDSPGGSVNLTLSLVVEQETCDLQLNTPGNMTFPPLALSDLDRGVGAVERFAPQTITLALSNCAGSARAGQTPAIQVLGETPYGDAPIIFVDDNSIATGKLGFGLRYQPETGAPGQYLKNEDFVDLAPAGEAASDGVANFLVDMQYGGGPVTTGALSATFRFRFMYH